MTIKRLRITIGNKSYDVTVEDLTESHPHQIASVHSQTPSQPPPPVASAARRPQLPIDSGSVTCPMAGTIKSVLVKPGDVVKQAQPVVILEAMKMENQITAPVAGTVKSIAVAVGDSVQEGCVLLILE